MSPALIAAQMQTSGLDSGNAVSLISLPLPVKFQLKNIYLWDEGKEKPSRLASLSKINTDVPTTDEAYFV